MKKKNIFAVLLIMAGLIGNAQVKDISVTISPAAEYTWWDNHSGLKDGMLVGGKLGFGFGEFMELRGVYMQSYDLTTNIENFGLQGFRPGLYTPLDVTLTRWGGEFKANIGTGKLKPYLTLGTGVQSFEVTQMDKMEQIYASAGLGLKVNLFPRAVLLVEAKNTTYNFNAGADLLTSADKANFGVTDADFNRERLSNWAVQGALQFYLGGRKPGVMTELDKAYLNKFNSGLRGIQPIIEPGASYIVFNENSLYRDTWLVGGYAGMDFNEYIGIRGFFFQSVKSADIDTEFDDFSMYGFELRARLNDGNGVTPFLALGGGYLDPTSNYLGKDNNSVKGGEFASGGLGLNIPLGKRVLISGGARAMLTSGENALDIKSPNDIQTHVMYNAGIKFTLGKSSKSPETIYQQNLDRDVEMRMAENNRKLQQMKSEYQEKINTLEEELELAYEAQDMDKAVEVLENKKEAEKSLKEVEKLEQASDAQVNQKVAKEHISLPVPAAPVAPEKQVQSGSIKMTPAEFESFMVKILKATRLNTDTIKKPETQAPADNQQNQHQIEFINMRIDMLEKLLLDVNTRLGVGHQIVIPPSGQINSNEVEELSRKIINELDDLKRQVNENERGVEGNAKQIDSTSDKVNTIVVTPINEDKATDAFITSIDNEGKVVNNQKISEIDANKDALLAYKNSSAMLGVNFGGVTTANVGARLHYDFNNLPFEFMSEIYLGLGSTKSFGISGNVIYPFSLNSDKVVPYAGVGLGVSRIAKNLRGNYNIIIGADLPFISKNLSVDYTMRNSFDYNQLAISYRLPF